MKQTIAEQERRISQALAKYWSIPVEKLLFELNTSARGLSQQEAENRLRLYGKNTLQEQKQITTIVLFLNQFKSPLVLILIFAAIVSILVGEWTDATIVLIVVLGSSILGFAQEHMANNAVEKLRNQVSIKSTVLRDGKPCSLPASEITPGDIVLLSAGSLIPADGVVLAVIDLFVNQAVLTGETFPVEKRSGVLASTSILAERTNSVFMGTSVSSGTAQVLVVETGRATMFGQIAEQLSLHPPETEFERGIQRFGYLLTQVMLAMVLVVLAANIILAKPPIDSLLFSLALAVGMAPELLPAIISITLSHGAQKMARRGVIVRRLNSIENFGSMDVLCTDKTGTLTEGVVHLDEVLDVDGKASNEVLKLAYLNAKYQSGLTNPLDDEIKAYAERIGVESKTIQKLGEIPYDFVRKRLSVIVKEEHSCTIITKGALEQVLEVCDHITTTQGSIPLDGERKAAIEKRFGAWSEKGFRVLGIALKEGIQLKNAYVRGDENNLGFTGFLLFFDPPKKDVEQVVADLAKRGIQIKIITGDNRKVALHVAEAVHLQITGILTGKDLTEMRDEALWHIAERTTLFAEVDPNQKERIILALQKTGHVVGYMGDGINDAPALHVADVGISVDTAVDVAKEAADFVLLQQDLGILKEGIQEGRATFANTLKYVLTTVSANFGNMFSMAGASMLLPFLPLLAPQILLNNFLSDIPGTTIASDNIDPEWTEKPRRWNTRFIRDYMIVFGLVSSVFDFLTFGTLLIIFKASPEEFRTGWFIESLLTELVIALVVRTRYLFFRSRPGNLLLVSTLIVIGVTFVLPYTRINFLFGFVPLPMPLMFAVVGLIFFYVLCAEITKKIFYSRKMI